MGEALRSTHLPQDNIPEVVKTNGPAFTLETAELLCRDGYGSYDLVSSMFIWKNPDITLEEKVRAIDRVTNPPLESAQLFNFESTKRVNKAVDDMLRLG